MICVFKEFYDFAVKTKWFPFLCRSIEMTLSYWTDFVQNLTKRVFFTVIDAREFTPQVWAITRISVKGFVCFKETGLRVLVMGLVLREWVIAIIN